MRLFGPHTARLLGRLPEWRKTGSFVANLLIGTSIAFFVYFVEQTGFLQRFLNFIIYLLLSVAGSVLKYKYFHTLTWKGIIIDTCVVVTATLIWTAFRGFAARVLTNTLLFLLLIPVSLYLFNRYAVVISAAPIVLGIIMAIAIDAAVELKKQRFRRKLAEEKQEAEFSVIRHLAHNVRPNLQITRSPLASIRDFLEREGLLDTELSRRLDGSAETIGEALDKAIAGISRISAVIDSTRRLVTREIPREEFVETNVKELLEREIFPLHAGRFALVATGTPCRVRLHRNSFVEAVNNLIRNAEVHGFPEAAPADELRFSLKETRNSLVIDYTNNGLSFPSNLTTREFLTFGVKSTDSPGEGLGGAWIGKVIDAHGGSFEIIRDDNPVHFRITLPKGGH
jgi:nitrogen-specific signal transduction histidine kinase